MKGIYPYDRQEILAEIPRDVFLAEFKKQVHCSPYVNYLVPYWLSGKAGTFRFAGEANTETWKIMLVTNYRNSFKPLIYMKVIDEGENTRIIFEFKVHLVVKIFMLFFQSISLLMILFTIINHPEIEDFYFPVGLFLGSFLILYMGFYMSLDHSADALNVVISGILNDYTDNRFNSF